ncbi:hypothetical protein C8Q77DRAFT_1273392 [Trametes polyzona]|nr:hypothetical protein C8Q77DRAFT_1273392 [Trametes polyzona]
MFRCSLGVLPGRGPVVTSGAHILHVYPTSSWLKTYVGKLTVAVVGRSCWRRNRCLCPTTISRPVGRGGTHGRIQDCRARNTIHAMHSAGELTGVPMHSIVYSSIQGLAYLHENRIVHRDIIEVNILVSCYNSDVVRDHQAVQKTLNHYRSVTDPSDVHYCLFDFDICHIFPLDAPLQSCRQPADEAWAGAPSYQPYDVWRGEHDYDPFAYDVSCLGYLFVEWFGMNTHIAANRFTASEAARFLEDVVAQTPQSVLDTPMTMEQQAARATDSNLYWSETPPEFRAQWSEFRMPPLSWSKRVLSRIAANRVGWPVLRFVRSKLRI